MIPSQNSIPPNSLSLSAGYQKDQSHLNTLSILHYVNAGLSALSIVFIILHYLAMRFIFTNEAMIKEIEKDPTASPEILTSMLDIFIWFYLLAALYAIASLIINFLAARYLKARINKTFTMVVAGINCINIPLGTVLGIFTLIKLTTPSASFIYEENKKTL